MKEYEEDGPLQHNESSGTKTETMMPPRHQKCSSDMTHFV